MNSVHEGNAKIFKAFCDPKRLAILELLRSGEKCACVLLEQLDTTQSGLSYHMKILCESGIVVGRQEGKWTHYSISQEGAQRAAKLLLELTSPAESPSARPKKEDGKRPDQSKDGMEKRKMKKTQLYALTGFLGSGKTTVLLKILNRLTADGRKVGIIQNEFGKLNIDGEILRNDDIKMVEISRGSIFCSCLRLTFVKALAEMAAQNFDYLFIESSGLGDPSNIQEILKASEVLCGEAYEFKGAVCLADALNFFEQLSDLETVYRQLKHCHLAMITKTDLVDKERIEEIRKKIREINPVCRIMESRDGDPDLSFLKEDLMAYQWAESEETTNSEETKPKTLFMNFEGEIEEEKLRAFLMELADDLYRSKGFFRIAGKGWNQVDLVGHRVDVKPCGEKELSQLIFISKIGPNIIKKIIPAWEEHVGLPMKLKN